ncbi:NAD(P)-dependent oxidoreductase [Pedobacter miscanthi]|uniref:NAD-dependent epimerase/dehydratase family protein n=1 Tax=Pedobacter miscanthi TaxID=2259170 RepID=UPI002931A48D|nr:NAD(P)-dependent oxidoreductase [Pedobacter miscanthi]
MVNKKVLVTGGSGYIGARLCLHLALQGYAVTPVCYSKLPSDNDWIAKMERVAIGDIRDENFIYQLAEEDFYAIIHLVSLDHHQSNGSPSFVSSVNITPVWSLLDIFSKKGLSKFLYFSTMQVYGAIQNEVVTELECTKTLNAYALTHNIGEVICEHYNRVSDVECKIIRLSNSYGAPIFDDSNCWWLVINDLCRMAILEKKIILQSDGSPLRDFIHGWDICGAVEAILETDSNHTVYNLSSGLTLSIMEIAFKIRQVYFERYHTALEITSVASDKKMKPISYKMDNSRLLSIGFTIQWSLEDGIKELFDSLERNER